MHSHPSPPRRTPAAHRPGFTMIELMIVIGVILFLIAVSGMVLGNVITGARIRATEATVAKVNGMVQQRQEAFQRAMEKTDLSKAVAVFRNNKQYLFPPEIDSFVIDNASDRTFEMMAKKLYYRLQFPMSFVEICGLANGVAGAPGVDDDGNGIIDKMPTSFPYYTFPDPKELGNYQTGTAAAQKDDLQPYAKLIRERMTNPQRHNPETESAELLYLILTNSELFGVPPVGEGEFSTSEVRDTDGDGLVEFIDGWGRPLRFYRWPTRLLRCGEDAVTGDTNGDGSVTPAGPLAAPDPRFASLLISTLPSLKVNDAQLKRDPEDGFGLLYTQVIKKNTSTQGGATTDLSARNKLERLFHTPETFHTFLIVSAGPDGVLGLYEPVQYDASPSVNVFGHLAQPTQLGDPSAHPMSDNITNRRR